MTDQLDDIEQEIVRIAERIPLSGVTGAQWTDTLIDGLKAGADRRGYYINGRKCHGVRGGGEWLWDFVWIVNDQEGHLIEFPLALESEWIQKNG
jgi:hypothetical protein